MGKYHEAKVRFLWFFFINPVAFVKSIIDFYKIIRMNTYQFNSYCMKRVKGTEGYTELHAHANKLIKDRNL